MGVDIEAWIIVCQAPGVGNTKIHRLLKQVGPPEAIIRAPSKELKDAGINEKAIHFLRNPSPEKITSNLNWSNAPNHTIRTFDCPEYPETLKEINDSPPVIYIKGNEKLLKEPQVAMVGSRQPTPGGRVNAKKFSCEMVKAGLLVNSGMAIGIDAIAHNTALDNGGTTVAVIATGHDKIYPAKNKPLAERIAEQGVLLSEFPVGTEPVRANFPRRNRLISALSFGVVVVEAGLRSGALITARFAAEQGKDVFAVPGSIQNPKAQGCHSLIQQGAKLVQTTEDILLELQPQLKRHLQKKESGKLEQNQPGLNDMHTEILESMGYDPVDIDTLAMRCRLPAQTVSIALLALEIENYVGEDNGIYTRIR